MRCCLCGKPAQPAPSRAETPIAPGLFCGACREVVLAGESRAAMRVRPDELLDGSQAVALYVAAFVAGAVWQEHHAAVKKGATI